MASPFKLQMLLSFGCALLCTFSWGQASATAKPVQGATLFNPNDIFADDTPSEYIAFFGHASVAPGSVGADSSTVNLAQMGRSLLDLAATKIQLTDTVSLGGLVHGNSADLGVSMLLQLNQWKKFYQSNTKAPLHCAFGSEEGSLSSWGSWMTAAGWANVPKEPKRLDYSYTVGKNRMVMLDTQTDGRIDTKWLAGQLAQADGDKSIERVFVCGYLPIVWPAGATPVKELSNLAEQATAAEARSLMAGNLKVVGYFCGSPGIVGFSQLAKGSKVMQVVIGNGGGDLDPAWIASKQAGYGFGLVVIYQSGQVGLMSFTRPLPPEGQASYQTSPEQPRAATARNQIRLWSRHAPTE